MKDFIDNTICFDDYSIPVDTECINQDFDDVDLYGTKSYDDNEIESDIDFEFY